MFVKKKKINKYLIHSYHVMLLHQTVLISTKMVENGNFNFHHNHYTAVKNQVYYLNQWFYLQDIFVHNDFRWIYSLIIKIMLQYYDIAYLNK